MSQSRIRYPLPAGFLYPAVFLSGATALVYEIVWARRLSLVLGSTTSAAAAVLSSFMLGLALGALAVGWRADDSRRPLRWYGLLELGIGFYALAFDSILEVAGAHLSSHPWMMAFGLLLVPAALMGGTLPVLARAGSDSIERGTRTFGGLYGVNTLGAVAGALLATFVLMESFGLSGSVVTAAVVNLALGVGFCALSWKAGERQVYAEESVLSEDRKAISWTGHADRLVLLLFFAAGFVGLALEMAWFRVLVYYLEGFTLAFGLMLAVYLLGLGGGALAGTGLAVGSSNPRRLLGRVLLAQGVFAILTFLFVDGIGASLEEMRAGYVKADGIDFSYGFSLFLAATAIILPGTFCGGMLMPIVAKIALSDRESIGRHTGAVYAATTVGAVLAPPVAGFWLIPACGVPGTIALLAGVLILGGTVLAIRRGLVEWVVAGAAAVVFVAICLAAGLSTPMVERSHVFQASRSPRRLVQFEEGLLGGVSVVEELTDGSRRLYIDGFSAAETGRHYGYMRMLGHLPVLLHPEPKSACVIAFGTGTTAGAVAAHESIERLVCVEIEPAVYTVAPAFSAQNRGVLDLEKTELVVADGREYLRRGATKFDVVTLEPLMPYTPAAIYLYTKEFYEDARRSLSPGGVLCQWIPPQGVSNADLRRLVASMTATFDHVSLWYFKHAVAVVGAASAPALDGAKLMTRAANAVVLEDLRLAAVGDPAHLLGAHVCSGNALKKALDGAEPFVDDHTDLEFRPLPRGLGKRQRVYHASNLEWLSSIHQQQVRWLAAPPLDPALALRTGGAVLATLALEWRRRIEGGEVVPAAALQGVIEQDKTALFARSIAQRRLYRELMARGKVEEAAQLDLAPDRSAAFLSLAERVDGGERQALLLLALNENALLEARPPEVAAGLLREMAEKLEGPERRFVLNRAHALLGEPLEEGEEKRPELVVPDLTPALEAGDEDRALAILDQASQAGVRVRVDRQAWEWFKSHPDQRHALAVLTRIGSAQALRAALNLARKGTKENLVAVAPFFCARYPGLRKWEDLCRHRAVEVREAAAEAAKAAGTRAHLPQLVELCADREERVRLSAFIALRDIEPKADETGYDYRRWPVPPEALAALKSLIR